MISHPFTRSFHELELGDTLKTGSRTITVEDIEHFAKFTGDTFYAHLDEEAAKANPFFPGRVAHGGHRSESWGSTLGGDMHNA